MQIQNFLKFQVKKVKINMSKIYKLIRKKSLLADDFKFVIE